MELRIVTKKSEDLSEIKEIYRTAFPVAERMPFSFIVRRAHRHKADFYGVYDAGKLIGLAYVLRRGTLAYLFFFAIKSDTRGAGYGTKVMAELLKKYAGYRFILAIEPLDASSDNCDERQRRHDFYVRCGLHDMPYTITEPFMAYDVMGAGGDVAPWEYRRMFDEYLGFAMRRIYKTRMFGKSTFSR